MHYSVPQFIEVEDKLIGPLTMKQFLWLLAGGGICFVFYFMLQFFIWIMISLFIMGFFAAMAFLRVYNMPLVSFVASFIRFSLMPQIFLWKQKKEGPIRDVPERVVFEDLFQAPPPQKPRPTQGKIQALAWRLNIKGEAGEE
jgi:hypothetical protein